MKRTLYVTTVDTDGITVRSVACAGTWDAACEAFGTLHSGRSFWNDKFRKLAEARIMTRSGKVLAVMTAHEAEWLYDNLDDEAINKYLEVFADIAWTRGATGESVNAE